jgi:hypothetical protein
VEPELPPTPEAKPEPTAEQTPELIPAPPPVVATTTVLTATPVAEATPLAEATAVAAAPAYSDRSTGLTIFGIAQIILGLLAALMVPLIALSAFMSRLAPGGVAMRPGQYISGSLTYIFAAVALITLGIGSVQMKRWARALTLVTSWYWLIMGILVTALLTAVLPVIMRSAMRAQENAAGAPSAEVSAGVMAVILTLVIVFFAFFLVLVPIAFVVFYSRQDVAETCRHRDPVERWTDRAPLPVLGVSLIFFTGAMYMVLVGVTTPMFPFFGKYLTGFAGAACFLFMAALDLYLAIALFRLKSLAWWIAAITVPIRILSMALTYGRADLMQAYSKMGWSDSQMQKLNANPIVHSHVALWWSLVSMVVLWGYLVWLKRFFKTSVAPQAEALPAQMS